MSEAEDTDRVRGELLDSWEQAAERWGRQADRVRETGMAVSRWLIDALALAPGQRVLELAAGPGDTGFMAAELIRPGGTLICSDAAEAMLEVARARAAALGVDNVEFALLSLEWIDLPAAHVDAILCRWGLMFAIDPGAALGECRRVLRPGGRVALAVWDEAQANPWATVPRQALAELGHLEPESPERPGMFALADAAALRERLEAAGFTDVVVEAVELPREFDSPESYLAETLELSQVVAGAWAGLDGEQQAAAAGRLAELVAPYRLGDGRLRLPGRSLVAAADA